MSEPLTKPILTLVAAFALPLASVPIVAQETGTTLVGTWTLNADKTEPPKDRTIEDPSGTGAGRTMRDGLGSRGGRGGRSGGGSGSGGSSGGARAGGGARGSFGRMFGGMMQASRTLKVLQADSALLIEDEDGPIFVNVPSNGKTVEEPLADQTILKTRAQWKKSDLVIERSHDVNGAARMTLKLDAKNPKLLIVDFHYENKRQRRTIDQRRIYDASM